MSTVHGVVTSALLLVLIMSTVTGIKATEQNPIQTIIASIAATGGASNITDNNKNSNNDSIDLFEILDKLNIQNTIRDMQADGTLADFVEILANFDDDVAINGECVRDVVTMFRGIANFDMWAIQMLDAIGKPHSGVISDLDLNWLGSFDECVGVQAITFTNDTLQTDPIHHFDGKYCKLEVPFPAWVAGLNPILSMVTGGTFKIGVCMPDGCNTDDMKNIMAVVAKYVFNSSTVYQPIAQCHDGLPTETKTIVAICILSVFGIFIAIGTLLDIYLRLTDNDNTANKYKGNVGENIKNGDMSGDIKVDLSRINSEKTNNKQDTKPVTIGNDNVDRKVQIHQQPSSMPSTLSRIFLAFSFYSNGLKILNTNQPKGALTCINGIRFFSMTWVILGHSMDFGAKNASVFFFGRKVWQWTFYGIFSATISVDTFFTMSGLLVAYLTLREMSKKGGARQMNWAMFYFHRYWRLTPVYMLVIMVYVCIVPHLGDGPEWPQTDIEGNSCEAHWWTNILYVNNYLFGLFDKPCMAWSWYLADDMQFYILSPLIIVPLFYNAAVGGVIAGMFLLATTTTRSVIAKQHEYTALYGGYIGPKPKDQYFSDNMYFPAHTRIGPYIVGLLTGYLLYRYKDTFKMKKTWNILGWFTCMSIIILIIYGVYPDDGKHYLSVDESVAYVTLHRTGWGIAVSWIIFACATGYGGWINYFLSWSPFGPLGRLSYCAYLVHYICLTYYKDTLRVNGYLTDITFIYFYIGNVVVSYSVAFLTSLCFEAPMMGMEKIVFGRK